MRPSPGQVACLGESMVLLTPAAGELLRDATSTEVHVAGAEGNVACGLAHLGIPVQWASRVGDDPLGQRITDFLGGRGVQTDLVEIDPKRPTGIMFKDRTPAGSRVHYYRAGSAASAMDSTIIGRLVAAAPELVHLTGINAVVSASLREVTEKILADRTLGGTTTSFDVNHRPALWSPQEAGRPLRTLAEHADIVFVGLDEAERLWGTTTPEQVRQELGSCDQLVVKDAERGAWCFTTDEMFFEPSLSLEVVDVVGAGDAFAAGFLAARALGRTPAVGLRLGHLLAACTIGDTADAPPLPPAALLMEYATAGTSLPDSGLSGNILKSLQSLAHKENR